MDIEEAAAGALLSIDVWAPGRCGDATAGKTNHAEAPSSAAANTADERRGIYIAELPFRLEASSIWIAESIGDR
jgi:hypothetical protein